MIQEDPPREVPILGKTYQFYRPLTHLGALAEEVKKRAKSSGRSPFRQAIQELSQ